MKLPQTIDLSAKQIQFIVERDGVMSIFRSSTVLG